MDCWLSAHPKIAEAIRWEFAVPGGNPGGKAWPQWPAEERKKLRQAYKNVVIWYQNGMIGYPDPSFLVLEPAPNMEAPWVIQGVSGYTVFAPEDAWRLYIGYVALTLAAEINAWVPWSIRAYNEQALGDLLTAYEGPQYRRWFIFATNNGPNNSHYPGYINKMGVTPANATYAFKFLKDNGLLGGTAKQTILKLLKWSQGLSHTIGPLTPQSFFYHFQHWGAPPVSRTIEGTVITDPQYVNSFPTPRHWTAGCSGTSAFLVSILRAANIPAERVSAGNHTTIRFTHQKRYLSHGDDPYDQTAEDYPMEELLIDSQTYQIWFPGNDDEKADGNVGRQVVKLALTYPGALLVEAYCDDLANKRSHARGKVYGTYIKPYYALEYVESVGFWTHLAARARFSTAPVCVNQKLP